MGASLALAPRYSHSLPAQTCPLAQLAPHTPQFRAFVVRSTQAPPQLVNPDPQTQALLLHTSFAPHVAPQSPQFVLSFVRLAQPVGHSASPSLHPAEQVPRLQTSPGAQTLPHVPQLTTLVCKSSQTEPPRAPPPPNMHTVSPGGQLHVPATHVPPIGQAFPHPPQSTGLVSRSTHVVTPMGPPTHAVSPAAQPAAQTPLAH
jgi:hypothetical protein